MEIGSYVNAVSRPNSYRNLHFLFTGSLDKALLSVALNLGNLMVYLMDMHYFTIAYLRCESLFMKEEKN